MSSKKYTCQDCGNTKEECECVMRVDLDECEDVLGVTARPSSITRPRKYARQFETIAL